MSIVSLSFSAFLVIFGLFYFLLPKKAQWMVLLAGNLVFYAFSGTRYLFYLLGCAFISWFAALHLEKNNAELKIKLKETADKDEKAGLRQLYGKKNRVWIGAALTLLLGVWILLKYVPFLFDSLASLLQRNDLQGTLKFIVPLGMSFYTFDAVSYLLDVSHGKYPAEQNFFRYLTFLSYFPHIVQGPFCRFGSLSKTLFAGNCFSYDRLCQGFSRILWGYYKKLIIADKLAAAVSEVYLNFENYWGMNIVFVMFLYGIQLYADFSGYMDIVCGISQILGIRLEENFAQPYFSRSVEEFWRRWHITLGHWFRDYVFFPINRSEKARKIREKYSPDVSRLLVSFIAMFCVWSASGLWHGAAWTFLVWGWLNMAVMFSSQVLEPLYRKIRELLHISPENKLWDGFRIIRTFCIVCFLFSIIRSDSLYAWWHMFLRIFSGFNRKLLLHPLDLFPNMILRDIVIVLIGMIMMFIVDCLSELGKWVSVKEKSPIIARNLVYTIMIFALILFSGTGGDITANFIYANF